MLPGNPAISDSPHRRARPRARVATASRRRKHASIGGAASNENGSTAVASLPRTASRGRVARHSLPDFRSSQQRVGPRSMAIRSHPPGVKRLSFGARATTRAFDVPPLGTETPMVVRDRLRRTNDGVLPRAGRGPVPNLAAPGLAYATDLHPTLQTACRNRGSAVGRRRQAAHRSRAVVSFKEGLGIPAGGCGRWVARSARSGWTRCGPWR